MDGPSAAARRGAASAMRRFLEARRHIATSCQQQQQQRPTLAFEEVYCDAAGRLAPSSAPPPTPAREDAAFTAVFLHGLLGSSRNWRTYCRGLAQACSLEHGRPYRLILADLRAHGRTAALAAVSSSSSSPSSSSSSSSSFGPPHTLEAAARDVRDLIARHPAFASGRRGPDALVGLSLGGKVALEVVRQQQQEEQEQRAAAAAEGGGAPPPSPPFPRQVWVLDSQPGLVEREGECDTSVARVMRLLEVVPQPLPSRQALYDLLSRDRVPQAVAQWLGGALQHQQQEPQQQKQQREQPHQPQTQKGNQQQSLVWEFDRQACADLYRSYRAADLWPVMERPPQGVSVHLVRGELSDRWDAPGALERVREAEARWRRAADEAAAVSSSSSSSSSPRASKSGNVGVGVGELRVHLLEKATHWLQASNPKGLTRMIVPYFN